MANLCPVCGKEIIQPPKTKTKRFCSGKCRGIWWHDNNADHNEKEKPVILCQYCGKAFHARWKSEMNRKFCSHDCYVRSRHSKSQGSVVAQEEERNIGWLSQARSTIEDTGIHEAGQQEPRKQISRSELAEYQKNSYVRVDLQKSDIILTDAFLLLHNRLRNYLYLRY